MLLGDLYVVESTKGKFVSRLGVLNRAQYGGSELRGHLHSILFLLVPLWLNRVNFVQEFQIRLITNQRFVFWPPDGSVLNIARIANAVQCHNFNCQVTKIVMNSGSQLSVL